MIRDLVDMLWALLIAAILFLGLLLIGVAIMVSGESPKTAWKEVKNIAIHKLN